MPSVSPQQAKTMRAIAHGWKPTGSAAKIPVAVAKEYAAADEARAKPSESHKRVAHALMARR